MSSTSSTSSSTSTSGLINLSGMNLTNGQGIDVTTLVNSLVTAASVPIAQWQTEQTTLNGQINDLQVIETSVTSLENDLKTLKDPAGAVTSRTATSSDTSLVTASAVSATSLGSHTVVVNNLATTSSYYSNEVASSSTTLASGTFDITVGNGTANTITIDSSDNTLSGLADSINNQNIGVTASVITDANGSRLALVSQSSGTAGDLSISNVSTGETSLQFTKAVTGKNASLTVDGVPVSSSSNTVTGAVTGLTLNLLGADTNTSINVSVTPNTSGVTSAISSFVTDYNTIIGYINQEYTFNTTTDTSGPLSGDSTLGMLQNELLGAGSYSMSGNSSISTLADLGITMGQDGTLTLDSTKLDSAVSNSYSAVQNFLQGDGTGTSGFANSLSPQLSSMLDSVSGAFTVDISSRSSSVTSLQNEINDFQAYVNTEKAAWTSQYDAMNVILQEYPEEQMQLQAELGNSNYANTGSNG
jgi:flagellar hook-associated protein 2